MESTKNRVQLSNLNIDVQYLIFEHLDLTDLISMAQTNEDFSALATDVFRRKFSKKLITIYNPNYLFPHVDFQHMGDTVLIQHFDTILMVLKQFGHTIQKLSVEYTNTNLKTIEIAKISEFINLYCSDTLIEFKVFSFHREIFEKMSKPFTNVEVVSIRGEFKSTLDSGNLRIEELFPAMRDLSLLVVLVQNAYCIHRNFPNLERLDVHIWEHKNKRRFTFDDIEVLLKMNRQIRSLSLSYCTRPFLKTVNQILPNLERLEIENYHNEPYIVDDGLLIEFKNVKNFTNYIGAESVPTNISFSNLLEFYTYAYPRTCDKWIDLVKKSTTLKRIKVWNALVKNEQLEELSKINLSLDEIYIEINEGVTDETIINFIKANWKTKKIILSRREIPDSFKSVAKFIQENFESKWRITETKSNILLKVI